MNKARVLFLVCTLFVMHSWAAVGVAVANDPPTITCPDPQDPAVLCSHQLIDGGDGVFNLGDLVAGTAVGFDPDSDPMLFSVVSITRDAQLETPVNAPVIDASGNFSWQSTGSDLEGTWRFCIEVSDGELADTCCFDVELALKFYLSIRDVTTTVDTIPSYPRMDICAYLNIAPDVPLSSFNVMLSYQEIALIFLGPVAPLNELLDWEYFTYRLLSDTSCSGGGPVGLIQIEAIADIDNGPGEAPPESSFGLEGNIARLCFRVTGDWNYLGQCLPINFCSIDCVDNTLISRDGTIRYIPVGPGPGCLDPGGPGEPVPIESVELCGGAICHRDPDPGRGDINLNGIELEVGDAVLFGNYFLYGDDVWYPIWDAVQIQATDVNNDGIPLTLADFIFLTRLIAGLEVMFPYNSGPSAPPPGGTLATASVTRSRNVATVTTHSNIDVGGALYVLRYEGLSVGEPILADPRLPMNVKYSAEDGELRILVTPPIGTGDAKIGAGLSEVLLVPTSGNGTMTLTEVEFSDSRGRVMPSRVTTAGALPVSYALLQNYPNPFNAGTVIPFDLQNASDWALTIYNIVGQEVRTFSGVADASRVEVNWDGADQSGQQVASGIYFYRVRAGAFVASKKMTLLK